METQIDRKIKVMMVNTSDPFLQVCQSESIERELVVRHISQQNSVVERMNNTLLEKILIMYLILI